VENRERVFAVIHAAFGKDHGDEMDAGGSEEGERCGLCEELVCRSVAGRCCGERRAYSDVDMGDIANDVVLGVEDGQ